jgi:tetratricopeptide (TPR) repeat protein
MKHTSSSHSPVLTPFDSRSCFIVYSSRETHIGQVIERSKDFLEFEHKTRAILLDEAREAGKQLLPQLEQLMEASDFAIVFLDGLRPNVTLELGMLIAKKIPLLILIEERATINFQSMILDARLAGNGSLVAVPIDVSKHLSDLSNVSWNRYSSIDQLGLVRLLRAELKKLDPDIAARAGRRAGHEHEGEPKLVKTLLRKMSSAPSLSEKALSKLVQATLAATSKLSPKDRSHAHFHIAASYLVRKNLKLALRYAADGLKLNPRDPQLYAMRLHILLVLDQSDLALSEASRGFRRFPDDTDVLREYINALLIAEDFRTADKLLSKHSFEDLAKHGLVRALIFTHARLKRTNEALNLSLVSFRAGSKSDSLFGIINAWASATHTKAFQELKDEIRNVLRVAITIKEEICWSCFFELAMLLGLQEEAFTGLSQLEKQLIEDNPDSINELAFNFLTIGKFASARRLLLHGIRNFPRHSYLNATMGLLAYRSQRDLAKGDKHYQLAIQLSPDDVPLRKMHYYEKAQLLLSLGRKKECIRVVRMAKNLGGSFKKTDLAELESRISSGN